MDILVLHENLPELDKVCAGKILSDSWKILEECLLMEAFCAASTGGLLQ